MAMMFAPSAAQGTSQPLPEPAQPPTWLPSWMAKAMDYLSSPQGQVATAMPGGMLGAMVKFPLASAAQGGIFHPNTIRRVLEAIGKNDAYLGGSATPPPGIVGGPPQTWQDLMKSTFNSRPIPASTALQTIQELEGVNSMGTGAANYFNPMQIPQKGLQQLQEPGFHEHLNKILSVLSKIHR